MALKKVHPGDPLSVPAATYNTLIDAARDYQARQRALLAQRPRATQRDHAEIILRNDSGADRRRFDALEIAGPIFEPSDNLDEFKSRVAVSGVAPVDDRRGRFAILLEPMADGAMGKACILGSCVTRVEMLDESHTFADTVDGRMDALVSGSSGAAQLLWVQPEAQRDVPEIAWAIARLGPPVQPTCRLGVVIECDDYDEMSGSLVVTCVPLRGTNYSYDPNDERRIVAWGGIDPMIVPESLVALFAVDPLELNPEIKALAIPLLSVLRNQLDMPDMNCLTAYTEPCGPAQSSDLCVG